MDNAEFRESPEGLREEIADLRAHIAKLEAALACARAERDAGWLAMDQAPPARWSKAMLTDRDGRVGEGYLDGEWCWKYNEKLAFPVAWQPMPEPPSRLSPALTRATDASLADLIRLRYPRLLERGNPLYDGVLAAAVEGAAPSVPGGA